MLIRIRILCYIFLRHPKAEFRILPSILKCKNRFFGRIIVLPGIEPGYIVFPSHKKQCICLVRRTAICMEHEKISSSAPGLGLMTHCEYRVDCPFPVTWLGNVWEPFPPPRSTGLSRLFNPRFPGLKSDTVTLSDELVISSSGSHSSTSSSTSTSPLSAISRLEHRVSVFPFFVNRDAFFGGLPLAHCAFN
jgi:hypothetical protein